MALQKYNQKRNFKVTAEPKGRVARSKSGHRFYIQKHDASHLHFDFRLEHGGVLKSWAVPKGPSVKPGVRRLAMEVEDHPLEYGHFEGTIPKGEYGGGTVMLWDRGVWQPLDHDGQKIADERDIGEQLKKGKITFTLKGERLQGTWSLVRSQQGENGKNMWFLIKKKVAGEDTDLEPVEEDITSVSTDRSMQEISLSHKSWHSNRTGSKAKASKKKNGAPVETAAHAEPEAGLKKIGLPKNFTPELATLVDEPPQGDDWVHEIKFDGYRLITNFEKSTATLCSRNGLDWTERLSEIKAVLEKLKIKDAVLDGELIAPDSRGYADFQELQKALKEDRQQDMVYYVFDITRLDKKDLRRMPLTERKALLEKIFTKARIKKSQIKFSEHAVGQGDKLFVHACRLGLEGIISKKAASLYYGGRSKDWLKVKCLLRQEFVIVGYSDPGGAREGFGALLLASHDKEGRLQYVGRTGTGFDRESLASLTLKLDKLTTEKRPDLYDPNGELGSARDVHWVKPKLVAEVKFATWTHHKIVRQAVFQGLREDKGAKDVKLEMAKHTGDVVPKGGEAQAPSQARAKSASPKAAAAKEDKSERQFAVAITKPDKTLFAPDITKADLAAYYTKMSKWVMPHLKNRPLAVFRCPNGHDGMCFFQKHESTQTVTKKDNPGFIHNGKTNEFMYVEDEKGLISLVQLGVLEIHAWGTHIKAFEKPDLIVFDLDGDVGVKWPRIIEAALRIRDRLKQLKLQSFVKTTGGKGLHIVVPLTPQADWTEVKEFTKNFAEALAAEFPDDYVANMSKAKRKGKIFIDYLRNGRGATAVLPYSTRAKAHAPVATPITWVELPKIKSADQFDLRNIDARMKSLKQDPWKGFFDVKQKLPKF